MFEQILVPLDGSLLAERAIPVAARLARASGGRVILLHVASLYVGYGPYLAQGSTYSQALLKTETVAAYHYLENLARGKDLAGIKTLTEVLPGIPARTIITAIQFHQTDLIVLCSRGSTGIKRWIQGSVAHQLIRHSPVPVLVLHEECSTLTTSPIEQEHSVRVVVALDGSSFAQNAIAPAIQLSAAFNPLPAQRTLHLVQVVKSPSRHELHEYEHYGIDVDLREAALNEARNSLQTVAETTTRQINTEPGVQITWSTEEGQDVVETLLSQVKPSVGQGTHEINDVLVLATHGREGVQRWRQGSITEHLLDSTKLPLLIVHPEEEQELSQQELAEEEFWREKV